MGRAKRIAAEQTYRLQSGPHPQEKHKFPSRQITLRSLYPETQICEWAIPQCAGHLPIVK